MRECSLHVQLFLLNLNTSERLQDFGSVSAKSEEHENTSLSFVWPCIIVGTWLVPIIEVTEILEAG